MLGRQIDTEMGPFRCQICAKTFTQRQSSPYLFCFQFDSPCITSVDCFLGTSRNRHVLYCRKKFGDNIPVLRKSCAACRKAKVKCNSEFPYCLRCTEKNLVCSYELTRRSESLAQQSAAPPSNQPRTGDTLLAKAPQLVGPNEIPENITLEMHNESLACSDFQLSTAWPIHVSDISNRNEASFDWEPDGGFVEDQEVSHLAANSASGCYSNSEFPFDWLTAGPPPSLTLDSSFSTPADCMFHTPYLVIRPIDFHYPTISSAIIPPRSPFIHTQLSAGSQIGRTFLLQSLQSYATLLSTSTLPPFIHNTSLPTYRPSPPSSAPLEICKSIVDLYMNKTAATSPFIWRSVTTEKDCFIKQLEDTDEWTMLSMLQAITVYIFLRIFDESSFSVDFDREFIAAMIVRYPAQRSTRG